MPAPGGFFVPNGRFTAPRSYFGAFILNVTAPVSQSENVVEFTDPGNPNVHFHIKIDRRFWDWSSNSWTLDWLIEESYYYVLPDPTHIAMPFSLSYFIWPAGVVPSVVFQPFGINFLDYHVFPLPPAPATYWMPPLPT
jgi:hypothetical protein